MGLAGRLRGALERRDEMPSALRGMWLTRSRRLPAGSPPRVWGKVRIVNDGQLTFGRAVRLRGFPLPVKIEVRPGASLHIGTNSGMNYGTDITVSGEVTIADDVMIGPFVTIVDSDMHHVEPGRPVKVAPIIVGRNAWICRGSTLMPGAVIGEHSVVAAGSVVRGVVPSRVLVAGSPAKVIRELDIPDDNWVRISNTLRDQ